MLDPRGDFGKEIEIAEVVHSHDCPYYSPSLLSRKHGEWYNGQQTAEVLVAAKRLTGWKATSGKLKGKMLDRNDIQALFSADANRHTDDELRKMAGSKTT